MVPARVKCPAQKVVNEWVTAFVRRLSHLYFPPPSKTQGVPPEPLPVAGELVVARDRSTSLAGVNFAVTEDRLTMHQRSHWPAF